jgi:hypothetical protein
MSHLVCSRRKVEDAPLKGDKNEVIHTGNRYFFIDLGGYWWPPTISKLTQNNYLAILAIYYF